MQTLTSTGARLIFAIPFAIFGLFHFMNGADMAGMVPIPGGVFWIYLTGTALLAAAISIIIRKQARLACLLLALFLAITALSIHLPGVLYSEDPQMAQMFTTNLLKDLSLAGAALGFAGRFANDPSF